MVHSIIFIVPSFYSTCSNRELEVTRAHVVNHGLLFFFFLYARWACHYKISITIAPKRIATVVRYPNCSFEYLTRLVTSQVMHRFFCLSQSLTINKKICA